MDQLPITGQSSQVQLPEVPKKKGSNFLLLEIGLFELGFVAVILFLVFLSFNFFNFINLEKVSPQLYFLPHLTTHQLLYSPSSTKGLLLSKIQSTLNLNGTLPQAVANVSTTNNQIQTQWNMNGTTAKALLIKDVLSDIVISYGVLIGPLENNTVSITSAKKISSQFLLTPQHETVTCSQTKLNSLCGALIQNPLTNIDYGILKKHLDNQVYFYYCQEAEKSATKSAQLDACLPQ